MLVLLLLFLKIAEARSIGGRAEAVNRAALEQQGIDQRRFPRVPVTGQQNVSNIRRGIIGHDPLPRWHNPSLSIKPPP